MIELNFLTLIYLFLRLSPFIIVCFFVLNSLFNQDFKGVFYVNALIASCFLSSIMYSSSPNLGFIEKNSEVCTLTSFSKEPSSNVLPIGQTILGFTYFYLLYPLLKHENRNDYINQNIITFAFYPILIAFDGYWNMANNCYYIHQLLWGLMLGAGFGTFCSYIVDSGSLNSFQYFYTGDASTELCSVPSKQTFKCNVYKGGQLIASSIQ